MKRQRDRRHDEVSIEQAPATVGTDAPATVGTDAPATVGTDAPATVATDAPASTLVMAEARRQHQQREFGLGVLAVAVPWVFAAWLADTIAGGNKATDHAVQAGNVIMWGLTALWALAALWWLVRQLAGLARPRELRARAKRWRASAAISGHSPWPGRAPDKYRVGLWTWLALSAMSALVLMLAALTVQASVIATGLAGTPMHVRVDYYEPGRPVGHYVGTVTAPARYAGRSVRLPDGSGSDGTDYAWPSGDSQLWPRRFVWETLRAATVARRSVAALCPWRVRSSGAGDWAVSGVPPRARAGRHAHGLIASWFRDRRPGFLASRRWPKNPGRSTQTGRTFSACGPFGPWAVSNSTRWSSLRLL